MRGMWHRFASSSADDQECAAPECGLIAADEVLEYLTAPCPAAACTDPTNTGACVMVATGDGAECAYCGRPGSGVVERDEDLDEDPDPPAL